MIGIYRIYHRESGKSYVGQSINIRHRIRQHLSGSDGTVCLDRAIKKYGDNVFAWEVLELCSEENLNSRECHWIATLDCVKPNGYNLQTGGYGGGSPSKETRRKIGAANKGNKRPDLAEYNRQTKTGKDPWNKGIPRTEEEKQKMSESSKGQVAWNKGKQMSDEARKNMSEAKKGKVPWNKGKKLSAASKRSWVKRKHNPDQLKLFEE